MPEQPWPYDIAADRRLKELCDTLVKLLTEYLFAGRKRRISVSFLIRKLLGYPSGPDDSLFQRYYTASVAEQALGFAPIEYGPNKLSDDEAKAAIPRVEGMVALMKLLLDLRGVKESRTGRIRQELSA